MDRSFFRDLTTDRLFLRNISPGDADFILKEFSDPAVTRYLFDADPFHSIGEAAGMINWYNDGVLDHNRWVIIGKETGARLGTCGFHIWDRRNNRVEIGYDLLPEYWGKGYMSEALPVALNFAFNDMEIHRVYATTYVANLRSQKVLERLGFAREGLLKDFFYFQGKYYDQFLYSLIKQDK